MGDSVLEEKSFEARIFRLTDVRAKRVEQNANDQVVPCYACGSVNSGAARKPNV